LRNIKPKEVFASNAGMTKFSKNLKSAHTFAALPLIDMQSTIPDNNFEL